MSDERTDQAEGLLQEALERHGARDPRDYYRDQLRALREENRSGYDEAVAYYRETLLPAVAGGDSDPLAQWTAYGRQLARHRAEGRTVIVGEDGVARDFELGDALGHLVLHVPDEKRERAMIVALPRELSPAQRATVDFLVRRKRTLETAEAAS